MAASGINVRRFVGERAPVCLIVLLLLVLVGCGGSKKGIQKLRAYPVKGTLTMDGQPFGPIILVLKSQDDKGPIIGGEADEKGALKFTTNRIGDGAPAGEYKVYFPKDPYGRETKKVPEIYQDPRTTPLTAKVESKKTELKLALDSKAELPSTAFADPTIMPIKRKLPKGVKEKEKSETEKPRPSQLDPKLIR